MLSQMETFHEACRFYSIFVLLPVSLLLFWIIYGYVRFFCHVAFIGVVSTSLCCVKKNGDHAYLDVLTSNNYLTEMERSMDFQVILESGCLSCSRRVDFAP